MLLIYVKLHTYQIFRVLYLPIGVCHGDIKLHNLLVNSQTHQLKLCDFGGAKVLVKGEPNISYICSRYYRAPEFMFRVTKYPTASDIWSAGCVFAELMLGQPLLLGESGVNQLVEIIKVVGTSISEEIKRMNLIYTEFKFPYIIPISLSTPHHVPIFQMPFKPIPFTFAWPYMATLTSITHSSTLLLIFSYVVHFIIHHTHPPIPIKPISPTILPPSHPTFMLHQTHHHFHSHASIIHFPSPFTITLNGPPISIYPQP